MELHFKRAETIEELLQILGLQQANLKPQLEAEEQLREGFVTVSHTLDLLQQMNTVSPHILAKDGQKVVGYALCMHPGFSTKIPVLEPMFEIIRTRGFSDRRFMVMGQICIDRAYRKMGLFKGLYMNMMQWLQPEFDCIITEVDATNIRSLNAHYAAGFKELATYPSHGRTWHVVVLEPE